jgi:hypothetical protein
MKNLLRVYNVEECRVFGWEAGCFISQLRWLLKNRKKLKTHEGRKYVKVPLEEWMHMLPFQSERTLQRVIASLVKFRVVYQSHGLARDRRDKTGWYTLDEGQIAALIGKELGEAPNQKCHPAGCQSVVPSDDSQAHSYNTNKVEEEVYIKIAGVPAIPSEQGDFLLGLGEEKIPDSGEEDSMKMGKSGEEVLANLTKSFIPSDTPKKNATGYASYWRKLCAIEYDGMETMTQPTQKELGQWKKLMGEVADELPALIKLVVKKWWPMVMNVQAQKGLKGDMPTKPQVGFLLVHIDGVLIWSHKQNKPLVKKMVDSGPVHSSAPKEEVEKLTLEDLKTLYQKGE